MVGVDPDLALDLNETLWLRGLVRASKQYSAITGEMTATRINDGYQNMSSVRSVDLQAKINRVEFDLAHVRTMAAGDPSMITALRNQISELNETVEHLRNRIEQLNPKFGKF